MLKKIKFILKKRAWQQYQFLIGLMIIAALLDTLLTYVIYPFATILMDENDESRLDIVQRLFSNYDNAHQIAYMAAIIACAYVVRNIYMLFLNKFKFSYLASVKAQISKNLFSSFANRDYNFFVESNTSTIQRICVEDVIRFFSLLSSLLDLIVNALTMIAILIVLAKANLVLTLLCVFFTGGLSVGINRLISRKIRKYSVEHTEKYTRLLQVIQQFVGNIKSIFVSQKQDFFEGEFEKCNADFAEISSKTNFLSNMSGYITNGIMMGVVFGYVSVIAFLNFNLKSQLPVLALFALGAMKLMPAVSSIAVSINNIKYNEIALHYVYDNLRGVGDSHNFESPKVAYTNYEKCENIDIDISNIYFKFEGTERDFFSNLSLQIGNRKMVAFIGSTGSGKTTLADIILGIRKPYSGKVSVNGKDIFENKKWWANQIGYIPQEIYLNETTILENVAFGVKQDLIDYDFAVECLKRACLWDYVDNLPDGIMTVTGENGVKLSGGQKQRIGIARALYNKPSFLVLDEATSALDVDTEKNIMETVNRLSGELTILIIAHRLSTIEKCDDIYRIENGIAIKER